ncbi:hypothetical protein CU043_02560 [Corynebacterium striatum]|nr:hypothetical protein [Corynebacterium striatum]
MVCVNIVVLLALTLFFEVGEGAGGGVVGSDEAVTLEEDVCSGDVVELGAAVVEDSSTALSPSSGLLAGAVTPARMSSVIEATVISPQ